MEKNIDEQVALRVGRAVEDAVKELSETLDERIKVAITSERATTQKMLQGAIDTVLQLTLTIHPLHLRALMDMGRTHVLDSLNQPSGNLSARWEIYRNGRTAHQITDDLTNPIPATLAMFERSTIELICGSSALALDTREDGNSAAHACTEEQARTAILTLQGTVPRRCFAQIFTAVFRCEV
ncbi:hypothetical protein C8R43DRAFT_958146 [Mycena crocata]|nr:hypothetical protein C8R43DRAFT_958146 [Mycena crocata]